MGHELSGCSATTWAQLVQPFALGAIAVVGAWIAWQQMRIARMKLQHDLYDRRYAVFQAARALLAEVITSGTVTNDTLRAFSIGTADAPFLLSDDLAAYLSRIYGDAARLHSIKLVMEGMPPGVSKAAAAKKSGEHSRAIIAEIGILADKFRPYLQLDQRRRSTRRA